MLPTIDDLERWLFDGRAEAKDGCIVEPAGRCVHGEPSWLLELGLV